MLNNHEMNGVVNVFAIYPKGRVEMVEKFKGLW